MESDYITCLLVARVSPSNARCKVVSLTFRNLGMLLREWTVISSIAPELALLTTGERGQLVGRRTETSINGLICEVS